MLTRVRLWLLHRRLVAHMRTQATRIVDEELDRANLAPRQREELRRKIQRRIPRLTGGKASNPALLEPGAWPALVEAVERRNLPPVLAMVRRLVAQEQLRPPAEWG